MSASSTPDSEHGTNDMAVSRRYKFQFIFVLHFFPMQKAYIPTDNLPFTFASLQLTLSGLQVINSIFHCCLGTVSNDRKRSHKLHFKFCLSLLPYLYLAKTGLRIVCQLHFTFCLSILASYLVTVELKVIRTSRILDMKSQATLIICP